MAPLSRGSGEPDSESKKCITLHARADVGERTPRLLETYRRYGLERFLSNIRQEERYAKANGDNLLTNIRRERDDHEQAVCDTLSRAVEAGHRYRMLLHLRAAAQHARIIGQQLKLSRLRLLSRFRPLRAAGRAPASLVGRCPGAAVIVRCRPSSASFC
jgi:hypothetical protein